MSDRAARRLAGSRRLLASLFWGASVGACTSETPSDRPGWAPTVDSVAERAMAESGIVGLSVAVVVRGELVHSRGYGHAHLEPAEPAVASTIYPMASVTKHVTATLALALVDRGLIGLDDPVTRWIDDLPPTVPASDITVRQLLSHTAGLYDVAAAEPPDDGAHTRAFVRRVLATHPHGFTPGTARRYSNTGFHLVGEIIERASGMSYEAALDRYLVEPLGLHSLGSVVATDAESGRAAAYLPGATAPEPHHRFTTIPGGDGSAVAAGFLQASAEDLAQFGAIVHGPGGGVLSDSLVAAMRRPTSIGSGRTVFHGLGTRLGRVDGHPKIGHTGGFATYRAVLAHYPDDALTIAVLTNTDLPAEAPMDAATIEYLIARAVLGIGPPPVSSHVEADLGAYVGQFVADDGTPVRIVDDDSGLVLEYPDYDSEVYRAIGDDRFALADWPAWVWHIAFHDVGTPATRVVGSDHGWQDNGQLFRRP